MFYKISFFVHFVLIFFIITTSLVGDYLVEQSNIHLHKALFDNATHAAIAGISWLIVCFRFKYDDVLNILGEVLACASLASVIDVDHFVVAKSLQLKVNPISLYCN